MMAARMIMPPATPPAIGPVLLLPELLNEDGTMITVKRKVAVVSWPSASVDLEECHTRKRALIKYMCVHDFRRKYRGQCGRNR